MTEKTSVSKKHIYRTTTTFTVGYLTLYGFTFLTTNPTMMLAPIGGLGSLGVAVLVANAYNEQG